MIFVAVLLFWLEVWYVREIDEDRARVDALLRRFYTEVSIYHQLSLGCVVAVFGWWLDCR